MIGIKRSFIEKYFIRKYANKNTDTADWNTIIDGGTYILGSNGATNSPTDGLSFAYYVNVIRDQRTDTVSCVQEATMREATGHPARKYSRCFINGTWTKWREIGLNPKLLPSAWVVFNGTDGTILDSHNISSVVVLDATNAAFDIYFKESMDTTNYAISIMAKGTFDSTTNGNYGYANGGLLKSINGINVGAVTSGTYNPDEVSVIIFGGKN